MLITNCCSAGVPTSDQRWFVFFLMKCLILWKKKDLLEPYEQPEPLLVMETTNRQTIYACRSLWSDGWQLAKYLHSFVLTICINAAIYSCLYLCQRYTLQLHPAAWSALLYIWQKYPAYIMKDAERDRTVINLGYPAVPLGGHRKE